ncbi:hypothetical protein D3C78_1285180 [compost metagenome]
MRDAGNDGGGAEGRLQFDGEILRDQPAHRRVAEVEDKQNDGEKDQPALLQQHLYAGWAGFPLVFSKAARDLVVDSIGVDGRRRDQGACSGQQHEADDAVHAEEGDHHIGREKRREIAAVVPELVARYLMGEQAFADKAERQSG